MKRVTVIYDDRQRPCDEIKDITGDKSFGRIIFKRKSLRDIFERHVCDSFEKGNIKGEIKYFTNAAGVQLTEAGRKTAIVCVFSDCIVRDPSELSVVLKKACYAEDNYRVMAADKVAAVIYKDAESFYKDEDTSADTGELREKVLDYDVISSDAFYDISDKEHFLSFITGGFEARFFNSVSGDRYTVTKKSSNIEKIKAEYKFYYFLPENMRSWFVLPYEYKEEDGQASYKMQRYHMTDLAIRYVHGAISTGEFEKILDTVFFFLKNRKEEEVSWNEFYERRKALYIDKVEKRIEDLKKHPDFPKVEACIKDGTAAGGIDDIVKRYEAIYDRMIGNKKDRLVKTVSHGDLCFSNILYSSDNSLMRFIDPKGAMEEKDIYSDPLYDIAKLSHSVNGRYDFMNSGLYDIRLSEDMKLKLCIDGDVREYRELFVQKIREADIDLKSVRLFECSLFLSMLPLHMDRPQKVTAFILNAIDIMNEIE